MSRRDYGIGYDHARVQRDSKRVWQLASAIGEIALRRRGPEVLPDSSFLVAFLLALNVIVSLVILYLDGRLNQLGLGELGAQILLQFGFVFAALAFFRLERRYRQTMSALLGVSLVVFLLYFPFAVTAVLFDAAPDFRPLVGLRLGLFFWVVLVESTIFARSLSQPLILGFMVEILYVIPSLSLSNYFLAASE